MPSLKEIRRRIASVKSTQKITRAMKMVAGARLTRAQARIVALRPYAIKTQQMLGSIVARYQAPEAIDDQGAAAIPIEPDHPFLVERPEQRIALVVLTGDRGLCGAFNTNVGKAAERAWRKHAAEGASVQIYTAGRKGRDYLRRRGAPLAKDFPKIWDGLDLPSARLVAQTILPPLVQGEVDSIYLVYNEFKSAMTQRVVIEPLLPLRASLPEGEGRGPDSGSVDFIFEPNKSALLARLVPMYVEVSIFRALLESMASELGARMTAMDSATKNANEMISSLTLVYNRARQAAITKELMEIIGGAEALKD
jgi:F-type H+-transporting ATPase subunit gamma